MPETFYNDYVQINKYSRPGIKLHAVRKLVIHYTANRGATAEGHQDYFDGSDGGAGRYAGAHLFADRDSAVCIIPLDEVGYHANDGSYKGVPELKPNANFLSIGIEMCIEKDGSFHPDTVKRTEAVAAELCEMFGLNPLNDIVRHYDITRKLCPLPWVQNGSLFTNFKQRVAARMNLQKNTEPATVESIVDYLNAKGQDASFPARAKLAAAYGIPNYRGTAVQNEQLLAWLKADKPAAVKPSTAKPIEKPIIIPAKNSEKEVEELELEKWQREELASIFKEARKRNVFSSAEHEKSILNGSMTQSTLLYLNAVIAGAALVGGERLK